MLPFGCVISLLHIVSGLIILDFIDLISMDTLTCIQSQWILLLWLSPPRQSKEKLRLAIYYSMINNSFTNTLILYLLL